MRQEAAAARQEASHASAVTEELRKQVGELHGAKDAAQQRVAELSAARDAREKLFAEARAEADLLRAEVQRQRRSAAPAALVGVRPRGVCML